MGQLCVLMIIHIFLVIVFMQNLLEHILILQMGLVQVILILFHHIRMGLALILTQCHHIPILYHHIHTLCLPTPILFLHILILLLLQRLVEHLTLLLQQLVMQQHQLLVMVLLVMLAILIICLHIQLFICGKEQHKNKNKKNAHSQFFRIL